MRLLEPSETLTGGNLPDPNLTSLRPRRQHLAVSGKGQTQDRLLHHHEVVLRLVLQILPDLSGREIPDFEEAVDRSGDEVLAIGRKGAAFDVRFGPEFDLLAQSGRVFFFLLKE